MTNESLYDKYDVDVTKLSRDYINNPLKKVSRDKGGLQFELPPLSDILYLYNECHLCLKFISEIFGISSVTLEKWFKELKINRKDKELTKLIREKTNQILYNVSNPSKSDFIKEKVRNTNIERYGADSIFKVASYKDLIKQIKIEKYGTEFPQQLDEIKNKQKETDIKNHNGYLHQQLKENELKKRETNIKKYGVEYVTQSKEVYDKIKQTSVKKYGVDNPSKSEIIKGKISLSNKEKSLQAKLVRKETNLKRYNREFSAQSHYPDESLKIISDKTLLEKYIIDNNIINIVNLSQKLHISNSVLGKYILKYDLNHLFKYTGSIPEQEILDYINQYYETENNTRKYLDGKEIDIYIPKLKLGIEFNGDFWHNEYGREKNYHQEKSSLAEEKGIFIYHIFEYEWNNKREQIINQLNNLLGINQEKIYARKCVIKEVETKEKEDFLMNNHLQGNDSSSIKLGLYYNNELVSLMTFVKPRFNKKYEWELSRFCSKAGCNVIGGASKLWNHFLKIYTPKSVISYSNIAHTRGKLYETLGFDLDSISEPNYVWCKGFTTLSRYQCQKHKLLEQGYQGNSEADIMHNLGYYRIYDCGNKVWIKNF